MKQQRRRNFQTHLADEFPFISFLILWLIRPCWFIDRSGCTVYDDVLRSRFSFPDFFFIFPFIFFCYLHRLFFSIPFPWPCFYQRKCIKRAAFNLGGCTGNTTSDPDLAWKTRSNCAENRNKPMEKYMFARALFFPKYQEIWTYLWK